MRCLVAIVVAFTALPAHAEAPFFTKERDYKGIKIRAHADVADAALDRAKGRVAMMLAARDDIAAALAKQGVELHIIGKNQVTSDLPEHRHLKGKPFDGTQTIDERTRGVGGRFASCGEENLLELPGDRYAGRDICVHEFAHTIRAFGLSADVRARIYDQYRRSVDAGRWPTYAGKNDDEFFAEVSMWWFGTQGDPGTLKPAPEIGRMWLVGHDAEAATLAADIYGGRAVPLSAARITATRATGAATTIRFSNMTKATVRVYWLDDKGHRKLYRTLAAGEHYDQPTFADHAWLITDDGGGVKYTFLADATPRAALIW